MPLENLKIRRICLHEVYKRTDDRQIAAPTYSSGLLELPQKARDAFASRVHSAFRNDAKCMAMSIKRFEPNDIAARGAAIILTEDADFVQQSHAFAYKLAEAQTSRKYPGGLVVIFDGTVGRDPLPFYGVMKAELHEGFVKQNDLQATFVETLFLTPKTKLYKIGLFIATKYSDQVLPDDWTATVYDNQLTSSDRDGSAIYFYGAYLGLEIPSNSARQVKSFFDASKEFIRSASVSQEKKVDLYNGLYAYLKVDQAGTIQVGEFAERFMPPELQENYRNHMRRERVPATVISKDLTECGASLRIRKLRFANRITLSGPPEAISDFVDVRQVEGEGGETWTQITIKSPLEGQE
ncbi:hypothetical protein D3273_16825 [Lichenibacterium minor]|uniref:Nucleoid-associated protein n=1 Tax=Lichenibacterium minor TaxID=2316528 RepID=A0A4Q2U3R6_9HYPH|nr:nucleoid-associated protein [Lichenibacterium minor]RYC30850.1 hypothetical protein D3273_16825 [Lichenibacterium minor]